MLTITKQAGSRVTAANGWTGHAPNGEVVTARCHTEHQAQQQLIWYYAHKNLAHVDIDVLLNMGYTVDFTANVIGSVRRLPDAAYWLDCMHNRRSHEWEMETLENALRAQHNKLPPPAKSTTLLDYALGRIAGIPPANIGERDPYHVQSSIYAGVMHVLGWDVDGRHAEGYRVPQFVRDEAHMMHYALVAKLIADEAFMEEVRAELDGRKRMDAQDAQAAANERKNM